MEETTIEERVAAMEEEQQRYKEFVNKQIVHLAESIDEANDRMHQLADISKSLNSSHVRTLTIIDGLREQQNTLMNQIELIRKMIR